MGSRQFEEAMKQLETIVDFLEGEEISLDEALKRYEEGIKLVRFCTKKLQDAEKKIEILSRAEDGEIIKKPLAVSNREPNHSIKEENDDEEELLF
jgi:exodeoxyribonuclease VII small subunit